MDPKTSSAQHLLQLTAKSVTINRRSVVKGVSAAATVAIFSPGSSVFGAEPTKATISEAIHLGFYIPIYVAKNKGLFAKHGIDMSIKSAGGIAQPVPALISGDAQFAEKEEVKVIVKGAKGAQNGLTTTRITIPIISKVGNSLTSRKNLVLRALRPAANALRHKPSA